MQLSRRALLFTTAALATAAHAAPKRQLESARAVVREILAANAIPALSIAVMRGDELLWAEAFGKVDLEFDVAASPAHRFRLGSVSKIVAATLGAELAARGVVDLDAPIAKYMPELPEQHRATTLRQLFTHRGGVRHYAAKDDSPDAPGPIDQRLYTNNADILAVFINDPLIAKPGDRVSYSTFGYTLASLVLEAAAQLPFIELVQRDIAVPLGLKSLSADAPALVVPNRVSGYHPGDYLRRVFPSFEGKWGNTAQNNPAYKWAGGGLLASPTDIARFGAAHLAPGKLSKAALDTLFTVYTERNDRSPPLGLGWRIDEDAAQRLRWHHAGGQDGARASLVVYPKQKLSIAFATNVTQTPGDVNGPSSTIADAFTG
ncbi:MAG TPA: serine hydrolase domain-containing protein [Steroidobacteraceae bacterium]|nr:serine hydrolase domain-containing protein [Steroidobacteraceae bacterium]